MPQFDVAARPALIQGGMGVAVSSWSLARAVSAAGQLGVVSGTALDAVLARRLEDGAHEAGSRCTGSPGSPESPLARRKIRNLINAVRALR